MIDVVSSETHASIQALIADLRQVSNEITNVNRNLNNSSRPSDNRNNLNTINQQQQQLNTTRQRANQLSAEEIVNQRQLRQNADLLARSNSALAGAYGRLSAQQSIASRNLQNLVARGRTSEQTQRQYNRELRTAQNEFNRLNQRVLLADRAVGRFNRNVGNYPKQAIGGIRDLVGAFGLVGGVTAFAMLTKDIFQQTKQLQSLELALKQVLGTSADLGATQAFLSRIADDYGVGIKELTKSYTQFYVSAKDKLSGTEIQGIFESISKAAGAMGLSVEQQEGTFLALTQMLSKGTIQAEELRGQLSERLPGSFGILAKSMGVTEIQLNKLLKDGKVLASEVLPKFAKELEKAYGIENLKRVESLTAETTRLGNAWTDFIKELNNGDGVVSRFFGMFVAGVAGAVGGLRLLAQTKKSYDAQFTDDASAKSYQAQLDYLNSIEDKQQREYIANQSKQDQFFLMTENMKELNSLTQKQRDLESKGLGSDPLSDIFGEETEYQKNEKRITVLNGVIGDREGKLKAISQILDELKPKEEANVELTKEQIAAAKKLSDQLAKLNEEYLKNIYRLEVMRRESEKGSLEDLLEIDKTYVSEKLDLESALTDEEINLAKMKLNEDLRLAKLSYEEQLKTSNGNIQVQKAALKNLLLDQRIAYENFNQGVYETTKASEKRVLDIKTKYLDDYYEYRAKFQGEGLKFEVDPIADSWFEKQAEKAQKLEERTKELKNATKEYLDTFSLGFLEDAGFSSLTKFFDQTLDPITGKMQSTFDKLWEGAETSKEKFAVAFTAITEVIQETFNFLNQSQQAYFDNQYARLEKEKDIAIEFAGESATAREEIERQYEDRRRDIRRREAEAQKELAIFNAVINTAQGVVAALANPGGPAGVVLAAAVGVIGAAQIALISQQSIPEYRLGTDFHQGGLAKVGDGGNHEVVFQPSSGFSITPKNDTSVDLERGSKVYPDINSFLKNSGSMLGGIPNIQLENSGISASEMETILTKFANKEEPSAYLEKDKILSFVGSGHNRQISMNNRFFTKIRRFK